ncbi:hypothetical protein PD885_03615 [Xanthomonas fragariae]|uniref:Uncharacterized protein n=1 Tax=Xanthomonas fragariae TaxID=48664 RepID=A0ABY1RU55_9XANT|nr:hypothetical protein PD885_03615 [Xanthomonas fragariae]
MSILGTHLHGVLGCITGMLEGITGSVDLSDYIFKRKPARKPLIQCDDVVHAVCFTGTLQEIPKNFLGCASKRHDGEKITFVEKDLTGCLNLTFCYI